MNNPVGRLVVLGACCVIAACAGPARVAEQPVPASPVTSPAKLPPPSSLPEPEIVSSAPPKPHLTIAAVGDLMLGTDFPTDRLPGDDGAGQLAQASTYLAEADVAFGNLEGALLDGGEPVKVCKDPSLCYLFRSPARYAGHLSNAGFDVLSLANNHARDFGEEGRDSSMRALDEVGIAHSGRTGDLAEWQHGPYRLAMAAFAPNPGSHSLLDLDTAACLVSDLAARNDLVLVSFHGGGEGAGAMHLANGEEFYYGESRGDVVAFARRMIDAGAAMVIGHGPHVPRAMESYRGHLIAYSLGNFATYYGISISDDKGVAPLLLATLDEHGRLIEGKIISFRQQRPEGPRLDAQQRAGVLIRELTLADLGGGNLEFDPDGSFRQAASRQPHPGENPPPAPVACDTGESSPSPPVLPVAPLSRQPE